MLYAPYGGVRYSSGTMPTDYGFTGQRADALTGLDYYNARYYDPAAGQFTSADTAASGGLNRYAYVGDSPENRTDPSGHMMTCGPDCDGGGGTTSPPTSNPPGGCVSEVSCDGDGGTGGTGGTHVGGGTTSTTTTTTTTPASKSDAAKAVANRTAADLATAAGIYTLLALGAAGFASLLTSYVIPWAVGMAMATGISVVGLAFWMGVAAVATGAALLLRQAAEQLTVAAAAAWTLSGLFSMASAQDQLSYGYVTGAWKVAVIGVLAASTLGQYAVALGRGFGAIAKTIEPIAGLLDRAVTMDVMSVQTALGATGGTMLSQGWLAYVSVGGMSQMEADLQ